MPSFYFKEFPTVSYDLKKNGKFELLTNITLRFKINQILKSKRALYFSFTIPENMKADAVAYELYGDASLDWLLYLLNDIFDPEYDWPLDSFSLNRYIKEKYGSISTAQSTVQYYEKIVAPAKILFDGTIIPEKTYKIDQTTYNTLGPSERREVSAYEYEFLLNDNKRNISIIDESYIGDILTAIEDELNIDG